MLLALIFLVLWPLACVFWVSLSVLSFHKILGNAQKWREGAVFMPSSSWAWQGALWSGWGRFLRALLLGVEG